MAYHIKAPVDTYNRKVCGVQFVDGIGSTEDDVAAGWFSGRPGFTVTADAAPEDLLKSKHKK